MRRPREVPLLIALVTALTVLAGTLTGYVMGQVGAPETPTPRPSPTPWIQLPPLGSQLSVLFIGLDSLQAQRPRLESVWVLTFERGTPQYFLVGFSPDTSVLLPGEPRAQPLRDIFADDFRIGAGLSNFLRDAIVVASPGLPRPSAEVIFDRQVLASAVDMLGGIAFEGTGLQGRDLLALHDGVPADDPVGRLVYQEQAMRAILRKVQAVAWNANSIQAFFFLGQRWSPTLEWFQALALEELAPNESGFNVTTAPIILYDYPPTPTP